MMHETKSRRMWAAWAVLAAIALAAGPAQSVNGQCQYEMTVIAAPGCGPAGIPPITPHDINSHGHICGSYKLCNFASDRPFYWTPETGLVPIPLPEWATQGTARGLNDNGMICGSFSGSGIVRGFVYDTVTGETYLFGPKHDVPDAWARAMNINNQNVVVGFRSIGEPGQSPNPRSAVLWYPLEDKLIDLGTIEPPHSEGRSINEAEQLIGVGLGAVSVGFLWESGQFTILEPIVPDGTHGNPGEVNEAGYIAGSAWIGPWGVSVVRGFVWKNEYLHLVEPLPGYIHSNAGGINDVRQVTGRSTGGMTYEHAMLWMNGISYDLNELTTMTPPVVRITTTHKVTEAGQVLGRGETAALHSRAVILTPIDRPVGDINIDCRVDVDDLLLLLQSWGPCPPTYCVGDINGDGIVDVLDLLILLDNWSPGPQQDIPVRGDSPRALPSNSLQSQPTKDRSTLCH